MADYDCAQDVHDHRDLVHFWMRKFLEQIGIRAIHHDFSKLKEPEKSMFDKWIPRLQEVEFGSEEYKQALEGMGEALKHHYESNRHHPEHFINGINDMTLIDLIEMIADWRAATERHADGDLVRSLDINQQRFGITDQLKGILANTAAHFGWI